MIKKILDRILWLPGMYQLYSFKENSKEMDLIYNQSDLNKKYYDSIKKIGDNELEHQIGRLTNFSNIISKCKKIDGDFIEFGSWKGFSLLWIAYLMERNAIFGKKLFGIDGFIGLPYSDGVFKKGLFSDTSLRICRKNVLKNKHLYQRTKKNIVIEKFLYKDKQPIVDLIKKYKVKKFSFIHIDCDVCQSAEEIFRILIDGKLISDRGYVLFDDYGWNSGMKYTVDNFIDTMGKDWKITVHSKTRFTKNFQFTKKK
ncbi:MAG: hypothetical protein UU64_C0009G0006 [candidate division WWE3 bacterium GW2011_GWF2_41_45]|uniref:Methyltransferase n=1 Tax=candidate division WWE3 bacterium GW2011_GWC2_41_23 TaxID=1619123 RepID=A0A0G0XYS7_UNCKA|nr:MAG: hypothetical protein UU55_C0016G0012 [candidate division WWE3 bacterium GW2011_GWC2_41_23]KKS10104.1 MAG: hypothetical protein UU64_C0009G0006 [candidate division WWE3 bacterium GW2011_GWF2_41_45]